MDSIASIVLLVLAPYWLGPLLLKFKQRRPAAPEPMHMGRDTSGLPPLLVPFVTQTQRILDALGYRNVAVLRNTLGVALLADSDSGTIATGLALPTAEGKVHSLVVFTTRLSTGQRLVTSNAPLPPTTPDRATDSPMRFPSERDTARLSEIHSERVAQSAATGATVERLTLDDPLAYQMGEEAAGVSHAEACGYWYRRGDQLALTWKGAILSAWRLLPPWRGLRASHDERRLRAFRMARE